jgi:DNA repair exonuclease SbcCD ATPase subunit
MEPLTFKIITDADDSGVRRYEKSLGGVDVTGRKASSAIKGFVGDLQNAQNVSDVTSSALNALTKILGTSLAATGVVVVGKLLVDAFNKVNDAVKESTKSVESANKEIAKIAMAGPSFETASRSAEVLNKTADDLRKNLEKINESKFQSFIAGLTGAREKMEELIATTTKQAQEQQRQAIVQQLIELQRNATLDETTKKIAEQQKPYQELIVLARSLGDEELMRAVEAASQAAARKTQSEEQAKLDFKIIEERKKAEEERIKELAKLEEEAAKQELKLIEATSKGRADAHRIETQFMDSIRQKETDRIREIEKQLSTIEARKKAIAEEIQALQAINAIEAARAAGSGRGPGQRKTSLEIGLEAALLRAELKGLAEANRQYRESVREDLIARNKSARSYDIDREIFERATKAREKSAKKLVEKEEELTKELEKLSKEATALKKEAENLAKSIEKSRENLDEFGKSLLEFTKDFEIPGKNMIDDFLKAGKGAGNFGDATNMIASSLMAAGGIGSSAIQGLGEAASSAASRLDSIIPSAAKAGADRSDLATESTLKNVLEELRDNLKELRSYAHAT